MSDVKIENQTMTDIADAIREKTASTEKYLASEMPDAIRKIGTVDAYTKAEIDSMLNDKVDKVAGKELSTVDFTDKNYVHTDNNYTDAAKAKVDAIPSNPKYTDTIYDDTAIKTSINSVSSSISAEVTRATTAEEVLSSRMDTFTKLGEGSTTGDAELMDIRVGYKGTTYNSAGDAVRGQVSQLSESIVDIKGNIIPNILSDVAYEIYDPSNIFTVNKKENVIFADWTETVSKVAEVILDISKVALSLINTRIVVAHNTQYTRIVTLDLNTGKLYWYNCTAATSTGAEVTTLTGFPIDKTNVTLTNMGETLVVSDGENAVTLDVNTIPNWNKVLYPSFEIGLLLNTSYVKKYPVGTIIDDFIDSRKNVKSMIKASSPLHGKKLVVLGDSYIRGDGIQLGETWSYKLAQKYDMQYENYGINGNCMVFNNGSVPMCERYTEIPADADIIVVQGGKNDFNYRSNSASGNMTDEQFLTTFRNGLVTLVMGLIKKYRHKHTTIIFGTPWNFPCSDNPLSGVYIPFPASSGYTIPIKTFADTIKSVCEQFSIPVFDCYRESGVYLWTVGTEIKDSWQMDNFVTNANGYPDYSHLNPNGQDYIMAKWEKIITLHSQD